MRKEAGLIADEDEGTVHASCSLRRGPMNGSCIRAADQFEIRGE